MTTLSENNFVSMRPNWYLGFILQAPDAPVSYYHDEGTPSLALTGPTSLRVTYGAPPYDGGDRITAFQVLLQTHITPFS